MIPVRDGSTEMHMAMKQLYLNGQRMRCSQGVVEQYLPNSYTLDSIGIIEDFRTPPQKISGGGITKEKCLGAQLEHTSRQCTDGQLTVYSPVRVRWRTRHRNTETQKYGHRQCPILCLARFTEPLQDNKSTSSRNAAEGFQ